MAVFSKSAISAQYESLQSSPIAITNHCIYLKLILTLHLTLLRPVLPWSNSRFCNFFCFPGFLQGDCECSLHFYILYRKKILFTIIKYVEHITCLISMCTPVNNSSLVKTTINLSPNSRQHFHISWCTSISKANFELIEIPRHFEEGMKIVSWFGFLKPQRAIRFLHLRRHVQYRDCRAPSGCWCKQRRAHV
jgi:hypothetical protein